MFHSPCSALSATESGIETAASDPNMLSDLRKLVFSVKIIPLHPVLPKSDTMTRYSSNNRV